jgi:small subunit ribosomal protein S16
MRLQRHGKKKSPFYHIVVAHSTSPRDGKFIEKLGYYNPTKVPAQITLDVDKALQWLHHGAEPTTTVHAILKYKGVLYKKHLMRGVKKGAFSMEVAEAKFAEWQKAHEGAVMDHVKTVEEKKQQIKSAELERIEAKRKAKEDAKKAAEAEAAALQAANEAAATETAEKTATENTGTVTDETNNEQ